MPYNFLAFLSIDKGSIMRINYPKLYNMSHSLLLLFSLLSKELPFIFLLKTILKVRGQKGVLPKPARHDHSKEWL